MVLAGDARREVGEAHGAVARAKPDLPPDGLAKEAARPRARPGRDRGDRPGGGGPRAGREDRDAVAPAIENMLLAAHATGLGAMWRTGVMVDEVEVREAWVGPGDAIVGFVYLGRPAGPPPERPPRPDGHGRRLARVVSGVSLASQRGGGGRGAGMAETVADQVFVRVEALMSEGPVASRAAAIRHVAEEMDRSVSATSSAYYSGARKSETARPTAAVESAVRPARGASSGRRESAASTSGDAPTGRGWRHRRAGRPPLRGDEEQAEEIAAGFTRWARAPGGAAEAPERRPGRRARGRGATCAATGPRPAGDLEAQEILESAGDDRRPIRRGAPGRSRAPRWRGWPPRRSAG